MTSPSRGCEGRALAARDAVTHVEVARRRSAAETDGVTRLAAGRVALALGVVAALGCGPSFQAVYECDVRFEHCYAVDMGRGSVDAKKTCWREWLRDYTYGQSSDRVEYAESRFSELSLDTTLPTLDTGARPRRPRSAAAPMPTSAFAPPPNVAESKTTSAPAVSAASADPPQPVVAAVAPLGPRAPREDCTNACNDRWGACRHACNDGACDACDKTYRACVPACFAH